MFSEKEDRRVRRTRKMLRQGLAEMMKEKEFKDITVKDITDKVDLNRGTFYLHYKDTYDLLEKIEDEIIEKIKKAIDDYNPTERGGSISVLGRIFDYLAEDADVCQMLFLNESGARFLKLFRELIDKKGLSIAQSCDAKESQMEFHYIMVFFTYGITGLIKRWFECGMIPPAKEMAKLIDQLIYERMVSVGLKGIS